MVLVHMKIALGFECNIHQRMARHLLQHMVEKTDAGRDVGLAGPVNVHFDRNFGLFRIALEVCCAHEASLRSAWN